jgi:hypothetical protein
MQNNLPPRVLFLLGACDNKNVGIHGYGPKNQILYDWDGNTEFYNHLRTPAQFRQRLYILWFADTRHQINKPDVIVNCLSDADLMSKSLANIERMIAGARKQWPRVVVYNRPEGVQATRRENIYGRFKGMPGLILPKTVRFTPTGVEDVLKTAKRETVNYPFIIRPCGSHRGNSMLVMESPEQKAALERFAYDGSEYYLIEFHDFRDKSGFYGKGRLICMDGKLYPRHMLFSDHWNVHASAREGLVAKDETLRQREKDFLDNFESRIRPESLLSLKKIYKETGLDYLGFDYAVQPDGSLLVFEINAAQNAMAKSDFEKFPYLRKHHAAIVDAFNEQIFARAGKDMKAAANA